MVDFTSCIASAGFDVKHFKHGKCQPSGQNNSILTMYVPTRICCEVHGAWNSNSSDRT